MKRPAAAQIGAAKKKQGVQARCKSLAQSLGLAGNQASWTSLAKVVPDVLGICQRGRDEVQVKLVEAIGFGLDTLEKQLQAALTNAEGELTTTSEQKEALANALAEAKGAAKVAAEDANTKKVGVTEGHATLQAAKQALIEAKASQASAGADVEAAANKARCLSDFMDTVLGPLRDHSLDKKAQALALRSFRTLDVFQLDPAILDAAPASLAKPPSERGTFDNMVLQHLESDIEQALRKIKATVDDGGAMKEERRKAVEEAGHARVAADERYQTAVVALAEAKAHEKESQKRVKAADAALKEHLPSMTKATKGAETARQTLHGFLSTARADFAYLESWAPEAAATEEPTSPPQEAAMTSAAAGKADGSFVSEATPGPGAELSA